MPLVVNTNLSSLISQRYLSSNNNKVNKSFERLSSGSRINRAADDAAGMAISKKLESKVRGFTVAQQNAQDGISILQIAEGAMGSIGDGLQRVRELTVQAANGTNSSDQTESIFKEVEQIMTEIGRIASSTSFNGLTLLDGSLGSVRLQIGADSSVTLNTLDVSSALSTTTASALGLVGASTSAGFSTVASIIGSNISNGSVARAFLNDVDAALTTLNTKRSLLGAYQNQLENTLTGLSLSVENFSASLSRVRDLDIAAESSNLTRNQVLQQSSLSILSQANQSTNSVLSLLQR